MTFCSKGDANVRSLINLFGSGRVGGGVPSIRRLKSHDLSVKLRETCPRRPLPKDLARSLRQHFHNRSRAVWSGTNVVCLFGMVRAGQAINDNLRYHLLSSQVLKI